MMLKTKPGLFKLLEAIILIMVSTLIVTNLLYIKDACSTKQCIFTNLLTIMLLVWATAFWIVVVRHSDKK
ncbi:MAG: hypothetical protein KKB22_07215 [Candidatus Omnitrophica bacterium]|nr:hypothetical protein [Candidatus Omnitrophota bacterium]